MFFVNQMPNTGT